MSDHLEQVRGGKEFIKESQFYEKRLNQQNHQSYWTNIDVSKNDSCPEEIHHSWDSKKINSSDQEIFPESAIVI